ncbi:RbsD/FucU domain-containing protein [Cellulosimicrobium sp. SH8]|uniref:RbsD/FucU domain-containing protein n=1 Tax=Cellulosimicrobium sp. SH8 TaxID=2952936 RepID=UPI00298F0756|nr:RbsD/FucU domain-containing protein [Cellulosimicrobium sp. SH8]
MLRYPLLHPGLIGALAGAGHGSRVLLADANYPHSTGRVRGRTVSTSTCGQGC